MNFLSYLFSDEFVKALGWTLIHSIWQIAIISIVLAILMLVLQHSSRLRYIVAVSTLPFVLFSSLLTFLLCYQTLTIADRHVEPLSIHENVALAVGEASVEAIDASSTKSVIQQFNFYFNNHFPLLITLWFLGILVLTLRFLGSLAYTQRLKRHKVVDITMEWEETLKGISNKIGLEKRVRLLESKLVSVPMVVGYLKPVILLPIGALTGLSTHQLESILAHELAHIYRKDYLVNIFQTVVEILFFYHPGIWWMSARIREEREHCCDDIAVQINENSLVYAKALTTLGELQVNAPALVMAATGSNGVLFKRIKRLLTQPKESPTFSEGFITACVLVICLFSVSFIAKATFSNSENTYKSAVSVIETIEEGDYKADVLNLQDSTGKNNSLVIIKNKKGKIVELYVNGKKIPKGDIDSYTNLIEESLSRQKNANRVAANNEDEAALKKMLREVEEQDEIVERPARPERPEKAEKSEKPEQPERPERPEKAERPENPKSPRLSSKDSSKLLADFTNKTLEIAKLGMEIGQLSIQKENLEERLKDSDGNAKPNKGEVQKLEKQIKSLEVQIEKLGKEIEKSGEMLGSYGIDVAQDVMDDIDIHIDMDVDEDHNDNHDENHNESHNDNHDEDQGN